MPTEFLQDDLATPIELPPRFRTSRLVSVATPEKWEKHASKRIRERQDADAHQPPTPGLRPDLLPLLQAHSVASRPARVMGVTVSAAAVALLWVLLRAGSSFSVRSELFNPTDDADVAAFFELRRGLDDLSFSRHGGAGAATSALAAGDPPAAAPRAATASLIPVTLVYEPRGAAGSHGVLGLRHLKVVHDIEDEVRRLVATFDTAHASNATVPNITTRSCGTGESSWCLPFESLDSFLFPTAEQAGQSSASLVFDGRMPCGAPWSCALPPVDQSEVASAISWLAATQQGPFLPRNLSCAAGGALCARYLRSTFYVNSDGMDLALRQEGRAGAAGQTPLTRGSCGQVHWYELAQLLSRLSSGWLSAPSQVQLWYGGAHELEMAGLLVALANDMGLIGLALLTILLYMRARQLAAAETNPCD